MTYKIREFNGSYSIQKDNMSIPQAADNREYRQFIEDIALGNDTVEGPDIIEPDYATLRQQEYPSREEQLDMMYWDRVNGTNIWEETIQSIKDKYPKTITGNTTIGEVPAWVQTAADNWMFNKQLREYVTAVERLEQYILSAGRPEIREDIVIETKEVWNEETREMETVNITQNVITQTEIEPLEQTVEVTEFNPETMESTTSTVRNPLIVKDEEERASAQAVVNATPQPVIDSINS